jgi:serine/threonine protein kinase
MNKKIGSGSFGSVFKTVSQHNKDHHVAIKVMQKSSLPKEDLEYLSSEIQTLHKLDHPNICKYYETYDDVKFIYLVMECVDGMTLSDKLLS